MPAKTSHCTLSAPQHLTQPWPYPFVLRFGERGGSSMIHAMRVKKAHIIRKVHDLFDRGKDDF